MLHTPMLHMPVLIHAHVHVHGGGATHMPMPMPVLTYVHVRVHAQPGSMLQRDPTKPTLTLTWQVGSMLQRDPTRRACVLGAAGVLPLRASPFFDGFSFDLLYRRALVAPIAPAPYEHVRMRIRVYAHACRPPLPTSSRRAHRTRTT